MNKQTFTITLGDQAENHVGMQKLGNLASEGFNYDDLISIKKFFDGKGVQTSLINLCDCLNELNNYVMNDAYILILKNGVNYLLNNKSNDEDLFNELNSLEWDQKCLMYGRIVHKKARHNLCFADESQEPDYENGKGRIVAYDDVPLLKKIKNNWKKLSDPKQMAYLPKAIIIITIRNVVLDSMEIPKDAK